MLKFFFSVHIEQDISLSLFGHLHGSRTSNHVEEVG